MPRLRRVLLLLAVVGSFAGMPNAAADDKPRPGIEPRALSALCERFEGKFLEDVPAPFSYGCELPDGRINCLRTTECSLARLDDRLPLQEICERVSGRFWHEDTVFECWTKADRVTAFCDDSLSKCGISSTPNEQPMP